MSAVTTSLPTVTLSGSQSSSRRPMRTLATPPHVRQCKVSASQVPRQHNSSVPWSPLVAQNPKAIAEASLNHFIWERKKYMLFHILLNCSNIPRYICGSRNALRIYWLGCRGYPTRGGFPAWQFGKGLTTANRKNLQSYKAFHKASDDGWSFGISQQWKLICLRIGAGGGLLWMP